MSMTPANWASSFRVEDARGRPSRTTKTMHWVRKQLVSPRMLKKIQKHKIYNMGGGLKKTQKNAP